VAVLDVQRDSKLPSLQVLRGVAAMLVVFHHYAMILHEHGIVGSRIVRSGLGNLGMCGVDIFFAISGFIFIHTTFKKKGPKDAWVFLLRRVLRIYPLYWLWTSVLLLLWLAGIGLQIHHYSFLYISSSFFLFPYYSGETFHPLLGQGWTLAFEMLFYLVFFWAVFFRLQRTRTAFVACAFLLLAALGRLLPSGSGLRYLFTNSIIIEFLLGMVCAEVLSRLPAGRDHSWNRAIASALFCIGALALLCTLKLSFPASLRFVFYGLPGMCVVFGATLLGSAPAPRLLVFVGDASYSIYLVHSFIAMAYGLALRHFAALHRLEPDATIVVASLVTIALSSLTYPLLEKHIIQAISANKTAYAPRVGGELFREPPARRISRWAQPWKNANVERETVDILQD
jgi:peptidoglycan/LPS O-acetylase OafA/YrhL